MSAYIHNFPADVSMLAACREVLRCEGSTPDQIAVACDYLWEHSADYTDLVTVREIRRAMAEQSNTDRAIGRVLLCAAGAVGLYIAGSVIAALAAYAMGWV